jgi:hypothetical protein
MRASMTAVTALAGSLLLAPLMLGPTQAAPDLKSALSPLNASTITLVGHGGGGGVGGGGGGGGGGHGGGWGGGGGSRGALSSSGGNFSARSFSHQNFSSRSFDTGRSARSFSQRNFSSRSFDTGRMGRERYALRGRPDHSVGYADRRHLAMRDRDHFVGHGDRRHFAMRDHDHDHHGHHGRHGHFVGGVWVWDWWPDYYGGDYYSYNDCLWLRRQALITGSPYWWSRYNACVGYY